MVNIIKKYWQWIFLVCLVFYFIVRNNRNVNELKENGKQTKAYLHEVKGVGSKGTIRGFYRFEINNIIIFLICIY